jgi:putative polyketide hydroxylase
VAQFNCEQSVSNAVKMADVERAIGVSTSSPVDPAAGLSRASPGKALGLDGDDAAAVAKRAAIDRAIADQLEHFDFLGLDLGFRYATGPAICSDGVAVAPMDVCRYVPSTAPGARLPHVWLSRAGKMVSSIDLTAGKFTLLAGPDASAWSQSARRLASAETPSLQILQIGHDDLSDPEGKWETIFGLGADQALVIRPDGHVAWRSPAEATDRTAALADLFGRFWRQPIVV